MQHTPTNYILVCEAKDYGLLQFRNQEELKEWLQTEVNYWKWYSGSSHDTEISRFNTRNSTSDILERDIRISHIIGTTFRGTGQPKIEKHDPFCAALRGIIDALASNTPIDTQAISPILDKYASSGLISNTPRAKLIGSLRISLGVDVATTALKFYLERPKIDGAPPETFQGYLAMALFDLGVTAVASNTIAEGAATMVQDFSKRLEGHAQTYDETLRQLRAHIETARDDHAEAQKAQAEHVAQAVSKLDEQKTTAIDAIENTRLAYLEHMRLKAPVEYWKGKAAEHVNAAGRWLRRLAWGAVFGTGVLCAVYWLVYQQASELAKLPQANLGYASVILTAGAAMVTTIVFWVFRFMTRLYHSERHMGIDAKLRATLAECYLALTADGAVSESERALVLPALFRPSADGVVQDEGGLDSIAALFARYLERSK